MSALFDALPARLTRKVAWTEMGSGALLPGGGGGLAGPPILIAGIGEAERALLRPSWRQFGALGYLGFDIAVLWATLGAVGYSPPVGTPILGYIIGYLGNLIPMPGGIGVLEGGLVGGGANPERPRTAVRGRATLRSPDDEALAA